MKKFNIIFWVIVIFIVIICILTPILLLPYLLEKIKTVYYAEDFGIEVIKSNKDNIILITFFILVSFLAIIFYLSF